MTVHTHLRKGLRCETCGAFWPLDFAVMLDPTRGVAVSGSIQLADAPVTDAALCEDCTLLQAMRAKHPAEEVDDPTFASLATGRAVPPLRKRSIWGGNG